MKLLLIILTLIGSDREERIRIDRTYELSNPENHTVVIDNIYGSIEVQPSEDNCVYLTLGIAITANSDQLIDRAKKELQLGEIKNSDSLILYTKAPFIKRCDNYRGFRIDDHPGYDFKYEYKLKVPTEVAIEARTIDQGSIRIQNISGKIRANNVNGDVKIVNAQYIKEAGSVNGDIEISFLKSPKESISFNTVNGDFDLELPKDFSAKVYFDSMNGDLYTAFDYQAMKPKVERSEEGGKFKIGTKTGVEIGSGGPELSFSSVNGNVYLRKSGE